MYGIPAASSLSVTVRRTSISSLIERSCSGARPLQPQLSPHPAKVVPRATLQSLAGGPTLHVLEERNQPGSARLRSRRITGGLATERRQRRVHPASVVLLVKCGGKLRLDLRRNLVDRGPNVGRQALHGRLDALKSGTPIAHGLTGNGFEERAPSLGARLRCGLENHALL